MAQRTTGGQSQQVRQGNESDVSPMNPAFVTTLNYYSFVVRQKPTGVGGANNFPGLIATQGMGWNLTPALSQSNVVRFRALSTGPLSNLFDNSAATLITYNNNTYNIGDELFYISTLDNVTTFTINHHRPIYRPGFEIFKNGVLVYADASVTSSASDPSPSIVTYNV